MPGQNPEGILSLKPGAWPPLVVVPLCTVTDSLPGAVPIVVLTVDDPLHYLIDKNRSGYIMTNTGQFAEPETERLVAC
jgi:hypothetical protein